MLMLAAAVTRARLIMTIDDHGQAAAVSEKPNKVEMLREQVVLITEQVATLATTSSSQRSDSTANGQHRFRNQSRCFNCN